MANFTCMFPVFYIQGDGVSTTFGISLTKTPILFDKFTVLNFPRACDAVVLTSARDSHNLDVRSETSVSTSGTLVTLTFSVPFTDERVYQIRFMFGS